MTSKQTQSALCIGIDDGRADIKLYAGKGRKLKIRNAVRAGLHAGSVGIDGNDTESGTYETEGVSYTMGERIEGEDTRFENFDGSSINRVGVHHALIRAGYGGKQVKIATGLPVSSYFLSGSQNNDLISRKRKQIALPVVSLNQNHKCAEIVSNMVCSEALSAWFDDVLDEEGNFKPDANVLHPVGIVDFGGRTIDTVWINPPNMIDHMRSGSERIGVLDLIDLVSDSLRGKFQLNHFSRDALEGAIKTKKIRIFGKDQDVSQIVKDASSEITSRIDREIQRRFGSAAELDKILFVGGGSAAMPSIASNYPNAVLVKDPEFANARGMYKFLRHLERSK